MPLLCAYETRPTPPCMNASDRKETTSFEIRYILSPPQKYHTGASISLFIFLLNQQPGNQLVSLSEGKKENAAVATNKRQQQQHGNQR